jgi:hypothetical protein
MRNMGTLPERTVHPELRKNAATYGVRASWWNLVGWTFTVASVALSGFVAADTKAQLMSEKWHVIAGVLASCLTALIAAINPGRRAAAYDHASDILNAAILAFEIDSTMSPELLAQESNRAIQALRGALSTRTDANVKGIASADLAQSNKTAEN